MRSEAPPPAPPPPPPPPPPPGGVGPAAFAGLSRAGWLCEPRSLRPRNCSTSNEDRDGRVLVSSAGSSARSGSALAGECSRHGFLGSTPAKRLSTAWSCSSIRACRSSETRRRRYMHGLLYSVLTLDMNRPEQCKSVVQWACRLTRQSSSTLIFSSLLLTGMRGARTGRSRVNLYSTDGRRDSVCFEY